MKELKLSCFESEIYPFEISAKCYQHSNEIAIPSNHNLHMVKTPIDKEPAKMLNSPLVNIVWLFFGPS